MMKTEKISQTTLAHSAYVMSLMGGGMVAPVSHMKKYEDHYLFSLKIPGVDADLIHIEQADNQLFIYHKINFDHSFHVPFLVDRVFIPKDVDYEEISATYKGGILKITMPYHELAGGFHREIEILKK